VDVAHLAPGALFAGDFEIVAPLGAGGMGAIYVAQQKSTGKRRALKLMLPQLVADATLRKRFEQEARIASLVESDHVAEVVGAGVDERSGVPWLAMELLEGRDLERTIRAQGPLLLPEAWRVLRQICHALSAAHAAGIVHRDLKPENVFLAATKSSGEATTVKLLDFGIAKIAAEATAKNTAALGSPIWMAPEQTERGAVTAAADVWALGLLAFYLLVGKCFWLTAEEESATVQQIMREVLFAPIPKASERARKYGADALLPPWFDEWFARCVDRDPTQRFANASKAFASFDRAVSGGDLPKISIPAPRSSSTGLSARPGLTPAEAAHTLPAISSGDVPKGAEASTFAPAPSLLVPGLGASTGSLATGEGERPLVRPVFLLAGVVVVGVAASLYLQMRRDDPEERPRVIESPRIDDAHDRAPTLPPELARTKGGQWFVSVKGRCNPVEIDVLMKQSPPPDGKDGAGFGAACLVLAGRVKKAEALVDTVPQGDRAYASWPVFEVVHPIADSGDDASAGPAMRLVLRYWPDNYMALYHAGMAEYAVGDVTQAREHLGRFLSLYDKPDGFTATGKAVLAAIDGGAAPGDCTTPLTIDPEGRAVLRPGCRKP
jgi:serine/threonine protein kinase